MSFSEMVDNARRIVWIVEVTVIAEGAEIPLKARLLPHEREVLLARRMLRYLREGD